MATKFIKDVNLNKDTIELGRFYLTRCTSSNVIGRLIFTKIDKYDVEFEVHMIAGAGLLGFERGDYPVMKSKGKIRKGQVEIIFKNDDGSYYGKTVWQIAPFREMIKLL